MGNLATKQLSERENTINFFMKEVPIIEKPNHWSALQINGLVLYDKDLRHAGVGSGRML